MNRLAAWGERCREAVAGIGRVEGTALALVLLLALTVRSWGLYFGLPHVYHPDEGFEVYRALRLGMGGFDLERVAKGGYYFLLFVEFSVYFVWLAITGALSSVGDFAMRFVEDPSPFWRIGRSTTAVLGTLTALLVWWQGRRMGSSRAGLLGALFLALSFRHVVDSHYITVDVPMTLFAFWSVVLVVEDVAGRSRLRAWPFALIAAFAVLNKLPAIVIVVPYLAGAWMRGGLRRPGGLLTARTIGPAGLAALVYCVANPGFVLNLAGMVKMVGTTVGGTGETVGEYAGVVQRTNLWAFYARALLQSQGPALLALGVLGAALGVARRDRGIVLHLAFLVPFYALIAGSSSAHLYYFRYIIPLLPGVCLLAGLGLDDLLRRLRLREGVAGAVALAVAALVLVEPGLAVVRWDRVQAREDTRTLALDWVREHLPHGTRILLEGFPEDEAQLSVPLPNLRRNAKTMIERLRETDPGKAKFWELKRRTLKPPLYDLVTVRHYEPWSPLAEWRARDVEYAVLRTDFFVPGGRGVSKLDDDVVRSRWAFREELERAPGAERVASFAARSAGRPGYDIEVWRLSPAGTVRLQPADDEEEGETP